jgi:transposase, IS30 family
VQDRLEMEWSPEQISNSMLAQFPAKPEMQVSHETIYQALYVQGRGELGVLGHEVGVTRLIGG